MAGKRRWCSWLLLAMLWPAAAVAERLEGVVGDTHHAWFIHREGGDSSATFLDLEDRYRIEVVGFIAPGAMQWRDSLSLGITLVEGEVTSFDVLHGLGLSAMPPVYTSEGGAVILTLDAFAVDGGQARLAGRLDGRLALQPALGATPDIDQGVDIAIRFDVVASRIEY
ncbi:hypothetical protein [Halomonas sp. E19]|uniref:hypothetical protein n=1 Tax=unclassified Halomonas TaxID=2609666 RepID=UPI00403431CD